MECYHRVGGILPIRLANAYLLLSSAVLETKLRAFLGLPGKCSSNQDISLVLIFYILINSARLSFCKARAVSFSFVMCGPVLWLTWLVLCRFFSCNLKLQRKHPIVEGMQLRCIKSVGKPTPCFENASLYLPEFAGVEFCCWQPREIYKLFHRHSLEPGHKPNTNPSYKLDSNPGHRLGSHPSLKLRANPNPTIHQALSGISLVGCKGLQVSQPVAVCLAKCL